MAYKYPDDVVFLQQWYNTLKLPTLNADGSYYLKEGNYDKPWRDHFLYFISILFLVISGSMLYGILSNVRYNEFYI